MTGMNNPNSVHFCNYILDRFSWYVYVYISDQFLFMSVCMFITVVFACLLNNVKIILIKKSRL